MIIYLVDTQKRLTNQLFNSHDLVSMLYHIIIQCYMFKKELAETPESGKHIYLAIKALAK